MFLVILMQRLADKLKQKAEEQPKEPSVGVTMKKLPVTLAEAAKADSSENSGEQGNASQESAPAAAKSSSDIRANDAHQAHPAGGETKEENGAQDKGRKRQIAVRSTTEGAPAKDSESGLEEKRRKVAGDSGAAVASSAVTNDSIHALAEELGVGKEPQGHQRSVMISTTARKAGITRNVVVGRMRTDSDGPAAGGEGSPRMVSTSAIRPDGVRGRGQNRFAVVAAQEDAVKYITILDMVLFFVFYFVWA
jgi:hypothetical protein